MSCRSELPLVLERWRRFRRALRSEDQPAMDRVIAALERNGPTTFAGLDDPLEAAILAVLMELEKDRETVGQHSRKGAALEAGGLPIPEESPSIDPSVEGLAPYDWCHILRETADEGPAE